jgi:hypothetical protein
VVVCHQWVAAWAAWAAWAEWECNPTISTFSKKFKGHLKRWPFF